MDRAQRKAVEGRIRGVVKWNKMKRKAGALRRIEREKEAGAATRASKEAQGPMPPMLTRKGIV